MECKYNLIDYLRGKTTPAETDTIRKHLAQCTGCRKELAQTEQLFKAFDTIKPIEPSPIFHQRVMASAEKILTPAPEQPSLIPQKSPWPSRAYPAIAHSGRPSIIHQLAAPFYFLRTHLKYTPAWAASAAIHVMLFGILALIFIGPTQHQLRKTFTISYPSQQPEYAKITHPLKTDIPTFAHKELPRESLPPHELTQPEITHRFPPRVIKDVPESTIPASTWVRKDTLLERLGVAADTTLINGLTSRSDRSYKTRARQKHGGRGTEKTLKTGLTALTKMQSPDGSWEPEKYGGVKEYEVGITGLAILAYLGDGNTHLSGPYKTTVDKGIKYLASIQQPNGLFGPTRINDQTINYMYNHGIASYAVLEDYAITRDSTLDEVVKQAIDFIITSQNAEGGWGYTSCNNINDTSVTSWQILTLRLAKALQIKGSIQALQKATNWLNSVTNQQGHVGYRRLDHFPNGYYALTAVGMASQLMTGCKPSNELVDLQAKILLANPPELHPAGHELENDFYYWYFGTLAMFLKGGEEWQTWNNEIKKVMLDSQDKSETTQGTWLPLDRWSGYGGRVYTTSMALLILEVYYRYPTTQTD